MKQVMSHRNLSPQSLNFPLFKLNFQQLTCLIDCSFSMTSCLRYDFLLKDFTVPKRVRSGPVQPDHPPPDRSVRTKCGSEGGGSSTPPSPPPPPPPLPPITGSRSGGGAQFLGDGGGTPSGPGVGDGARPMPDLSDEATRQVMPLG